MKLSFELLANTSPEEVWKLYANIDKWYKWDSKLKNIILEGNFSIGSTGNIEVENQPPISYKIVDLQETKSFCTKTTIKMVSLMSKALIYCNSYLAMYRELCLQ